MGYQSFKEVRVWQKAKKILVACGRPFTDSPIHPFTNKKGVTLVELMITLVIFTIVISMIYSVFNAFIKQATSERKTAKTEMDVINVAWPLLKEIQSAGFGAPKFDCTPTTQCDCHISVSGSTLTIHSTAAGNSENAGKWSYVGTSCAVPGLPTTAGEDATVVMNILNKTRMTRTTVAAANTLDGCLSDWTGNIAYWSPYESGTDLECYETTYSLQPLSATSPGMCATGTQILSRSVSRTTTPDYEPVVDCVLDLDYRFGCINSSGALTWQAGTDCVNSKLRLVKVGIVVQSSPRRDLQGSNTITLFEDLGATSQKTITLDSINATLRYYKWRKIEQTIILKNLE